MNKSDVMALLKEHQNERGLQHWERLGMDSGGLKSFGIGLTQLRKIAKQIGRDHRLARQLWKSGNHDAKVVGLLIDEPARLTREQIEEQVEGVGAGSLSHVFSSCDATLPKAPFALDVAKDWMTSKDEIRRRCAWGLLYELSKDKRNKKLTDEFFLTCIAKIETDIAKEENWVRLAMGGALMGIGKRNKILNKAALKLAKALGPITYDAGDTGCEPLDVVKHLTSDSLKKKLGI